MPHTMLCDRPVTHDSHVWRETGGTRRTLRCYGRDAALQPHSVRLRPDAFTPAALRAFGWASPAAAAHAVGVAPSTLRRAIAGQIAPGERLIAALMVGTGHTFEALFTVQPEGGGTV